MTHHNQSSGLDNNSLGNNINDPMGTRSILSLIREGMEVYDSQNDHIGSVEFVHFGASSDVQQELGTGPATIMPADEPRMGNHSFIDNLVNVFNDDDVPEVVRARLLNDGYIRLDTSGLFARDRYITVDQIRGVEDDKVHLAVTRDQLFKPE